MGCVVSVANIGLTVAAHPHEADADGTQTLSSQYDFYGRAVASRVNGLRILVLLGLLLAIPLVPAQTRAFTDPERDERTSIMGDWPSGVPPACTDPSVDVTRVWASNDGDVVSFEAVFRGIVAHTQASCNGAEWASASQFYTVSLSGETGDSLEAIMFVEDDTPRFACVSVRYLAYDEEHGLYPKSTKCVALLLHDWHFLWFDIPASGTADQNFEPPYAYNIPELTHVRITATTNLDTTKGALGLRPALLTVQDSASDG